MLRLPRQIAFVAALLVACGPPSPATDAAGDGGVDAIDAIDAALDVPDVADVVISVPVTVNTTRGPVVGRTVNGTSVFLGIPYAAPPVGPRRWRPPADRDAWTIPYDATAPMLACPQRAGIGGSAAPAQEDDCLKLNVWTPTTTPTPPVTPAPVMVFIHGGGFTGGSANQNLYDGALLASTYHVVVIAMNYRLGPLGFLAHPALTAEDSHHSSGNYGFLDQQFALQWVQANAAAFGGDPHAVTLFGESAGAISVCAHLVSTLSAGLFQRAIMESGTCSFLLSPLHDDATSPYESAESLGRHVADTLGCSSAPDVLACMRAASVTDVLNAQPRALEDLQRFAAHYEPVTDGYVFTEPPWRAFLAGRVSRVPTILGVNHDEGSAFSLVLAIDTQTQYDDAIRRLVPDHVAEVNMLYPRASYDSFNAAFAAFITDGVFACPARLAAAALAAIEPHTYLYEFTRVNNIGRTFHLGAFHGSEIPFVFGNFVSPFTPSNADRAVATGVMGYWTRFAFRGDPNGGEAPAWPPYATTDDQYLELGDVITPHTGLHRAACSVIAPWLAPQ